MPIQLILLNNLDNNIPLNPLIRSLQHRLTQHPKLNPILRILPIPISKQILNKHNKIVLSLLVNPIPDHLADEIEQPVQSILCLLLLGLFHYGLL